MPEEPSVCYKPRGDCTIRYIETVKPVTFFRRIASQEPSGGRIAKRGTGIAPGTTRRDHHFGSCHSGCRRSQRSRPHHRHQRRLSQRTRRRLGAERFQQTGGSRATRLLSSGLWQLGTVYRSMLGRRSVWARYRCLALGRGQASEAARLRRLYTRKPRWIHAAENRM